MKKERSLEIKEAKHLLEPGYTPVETGYSDLANGYTHVRVYTRMPRCKGKMIDWWFGFYLKDTEAYKLWHPKSHLSLEWDELWKQGHYIGASHNVEELIDGNLLKARIQFYDPSEIFDVSKFEESNVGTAICANVYMNEIPNVSIIHFVRDTDFGCEMKSRLWLFHPGAGNGVMRHCMEEMGNLADFLPDLYAGENTTK